MEDRYPTGPLEGKKASRGALGQLPHKAIPSWAGTELLAEWADLRKKQSQAQATRHTRALSVAPTQLPACDALEYRGRLGISRQDCRKISSVGSLVLRIYIIVTYACSAPWSSI
jgi:hypothetical protein